MKAQDFLRWMDQNGLVYASDVAETLGAARNTVQVWLNLAKDGEDIPIKRSVALAMSAIHHRVEPWGDVS